MMAQRFFNESIIHFLEILEPWENQQNVFLMDIVIET